MGKNCTRLHERIPDAIFDAMPHPSRTRSSTPGKDKKGKGKAKRAPSGDKSKKGFVRYCHEFFREGKCSREKDGATCPFPHLNKEQVEKEREKMRDVKI